MLHTRAEQSGAAGPCPGTSMPAKQAWRQPELRAIEEFLQLLARAVHQFHAYPAESPLCLDAITACHCALASFGDCDELAFRVTSHELMAGDTGLGAGTIVEHELVRRLRRADVSVIAIDVAASARDLSWFCGDLIAAQRGTGRTATLAEVLTDHGVDAITPRMASRPEILSIGMPSAPLCRVVEHERKRREAVEAGGPTANLYPPDKGWIRLDPASPFQAISLVDLAILLDDPHKLAGVLLRLTDEDEDGAPEASATALERKFSDVARLYSSVDPMLARLLFQKLARSVLDLEPTRRQALLRRTILPGLLDDRVEGAILADFPDVELAGALCLLLDLETAAPAVLSTALDRMNLPAERRQVVVPLLEAAMEARSNGRQACEVSGKTPAIEVYARKLVRIDAAAGRTFADLAAFDLSVDETTNAAIGSVRDEAQATDVVVAQLRCLGQLVRLEPNPELVGRFLARASALMGELVRASRWFEVASWLLEGRGLAETIGQNRPDVAEMIRGTLAAFCTTERTARLVELYDAGGDERAAAASVIEACGSGMASSCVVLLRDLEGRPEARSLVRMMCGHARLLAPGLAAEMGQADLASARIILKVLGIAGPGYEAAIASRLEQRDESTFREALRALARVGTGRAAALIAAQIFDGSGWMRAAAEEALWRVPPAHAHEQVRELLARRGFVLRNPEAAWRLLDRAEQTGADNLDSTVAPLAPLRFRFWNRPLARVGRRARKMARG